MAKQLDVSKANKTQLAEYLVKKLTKEDLQTVAQHVQDGTFDTGMLRGATPAPHVPVHGDQHGPGPDPVGVTPADTTASLEGDEAGNAY